MCGRYFRQSDKQRIAEAFHLGKLVDWPLEVAPQSNIAPTSMQPIVVADRDTGEPSLRIARWGLIPFWAKDPKALKLSTFNAKAETLLDKPMWATPFKKRRCLVPADGFYEWKKLDAKHKQPIAFSLKDGGPLAFAGLWEHWRSPDATLEFDTYSIITTDPNELSADVHDRMPVILKPTDYTRWLDTTTTPDQPPLDLLRPYDANQMQREERDPKATPNLTAGIEAPLFPGP